MPHHPKPFFRNSRGLWYVQIRGRQVNLGPLRDVAFQKYHELMVAPEPPPELPSQAVLTLVDEFLSWCQKHREARTYDWYKERCQSFINTIAPTMTAYELKPFHVQRWVDGKDTWSSGMKRGAIMAIQRAFNWAVKLGYIDKSPIARMEKPTAGRRELVITPEFYASILKHVRDEPFRNLITVAWETGARPQELLVIQARHLDLAAGRIIFSQSEAKGKRRARVIYLTPHCIEIFSKLVRRFPEGSLLRNGNGRPWTRFAVNCRFCHLKKVLKIKVCLYTFRHSFCQRALKGGVDPITLANLMGHSDTSMIARVYSHLSQDTAFLRASLMKTEVAGGEASAA
jgi:integrase